MPDRADGPSVSFGVVLPHFGPICSRDMLLGAARAAEEAGYSCLWARDHLAYRPHRWEPASTRFIDQYLALAAAAAVTRTIALGAGATIPFRSPHHVALLARSLAQVADRRVEIGLGLGDYGDELVLAGRREGDGPELRRLTMDLLQAEAGTAGGSDVRLWWAGGGPRSLEGAAWRRVGWLAGRQPVAQLRVRMDERRRLAEQTGWAPPVAVWVLTDYDASTGRCGDRLSADLVLQHARGGTIDTGAGAWRGSVALGEIDDVLADLRDVRDCGVEHMVFDFRFSKVETWVRDAVAFLEVVERNLIGRRPGGQHS